MVKLGDEVRDKVSGFCGIVVAKTEYLNGCCRMSVQPKIKDGEMKLPDYATFDEPQLELVESGVAKKDDERTGGPEKYMPSERPL